MKKDCEHCKTKLIQRFKKAQSALNNRFFDLKAEPTNMRAQHRFNQALSAWSIAVEKVNEEMRKK